MEASNIRVFKMLFPDGIITFSASIDGGVEVGFALVKDLAEWCKEEVEQLLQGGAHEVNIDFTPEHDIICPRTLAPRRCLPLSPEDREFWKYFAPPVLAYR